MRQRQRVLTYKRECYRVLYLHFFGQAAAAEDAPQAGVRTLMPGHPDFSQAVRLVREARLARGPVAAMAVWRAIGLPWVPELDDAPTSGLAAPDDAVARFALEGIERVQGVMTPDAMLWPAFMEFCLARGLVDPGKGSFQTRFGRMGFSKRQMNGRSVFVNLRPCAAAGVGGAE